MTSYKAVVMTERELNIKWERKLKSTVPSHYPTLQHQNAFQGMLMRYYILPMIVF